MRRGEPSPWSRLCPRASDSIVTISPDNRPTVNYVSRFQVDSDDVVRSRLLGSQPQSTGSSGTAGKFGPAIVDGKQPLAPQEPGPNRMVVTFLGYQRFLE